MLLPLCGGLSACVPRVACAPLQAPLAVQEVASVEDQVSVALAPTVMVVGATEIVTVGALAEEAPNLAMNAEASPGKVA